MDLHRREQLSHSHKWAEFITGICNWVDNWIDDCYVMHIFDEGVFRHAEPLEPGIMAHHLLLVKSAFIIVMPKHLLHLVCYLCNCPTHNSQFALLGPSRTSPFSVGFLQSFMLVAVQPTALVNSCLTSQESRVGRVLNNSYSRVSHCGWVSY